MGNRMIKDTIRTSKSVNSMSDFEFRLWIHLITYVDDYGRGSADSELLKGFVFPRRKSVTESQIEKALAGLASKGIIHLYEVDGESYFCLPNWHKHQRIQAKKAKFPEPPDYDAECESTEIHGESRWVTVSHGESPLEIETEVEEETETKRESTPARKHKHGEYENVLLTDAEYEKLKVQFPSDYSQRIERLSAYIASKGAKYKSHYATIRNWASKDAAEADKGKFGSFDTDEMYSAAMTRAMEGK